MENMVYPKGSITYVNPLIRRVDNKHVRLDALHLKVEANNDEFECVPEYKEELAASTHTDGAITQVPDSLDGTPMNSEFKFSKYQRYTEINCLLGEPFDDNQTNEWLLNVCNTKQFDYLCSQSYRDDSSGNHDSVCDAAVDPCLENTSVYPNYANVKGDKGGRIVINRKEKCKDKGNNGVTAESTKSVKIKYRYENQLDSTDVLAEQRNMVDQGKDFLTDSLAPEYVRPPVEPLTEKCEGRERFSNTTCIRCNASWKNMLFIPCGHVVMCSECTKDATMCPKCEETIREKVQTVMA